MIEEFYTSYAQRKLIPTQIIGILVAILKKYYSLPGMENLFFRAGVPAGLPEENFDRETDKIIRIQDCLQTINQKSCNPLEVLGVILEDFKKFESEQHDWWLYEDPKEINLWKKDLEANYTLSCQTRIAIL